MLGRWLGSKRLSHSELIAYEKELVGYGVNLKRGSAATELLNSKGARAAFDSFDNAVYFKKNATRHRRKRFLQRLLIAVDLRRMIHP